jgi:hypothetical protein
MEALILPTVFAIYITIVVLVEKGLEKRRENI